MGEQGHTPTTSTPSEEQPLWKLLIVPVFFIPLAGLLFWMGPQSSVVCTRNSDGATPQCTLKRSFAGVVTLEEAQFELTGAELGSQQERTRGVFTHQVQLKSASKVYPLVDHFTDVNVDAMKSDVAMAQQFLSTPNARRLELSDTNLPLMALGVGSLLAAIAPLFAVVYRTVARK